MRDPPGDRAEPAHRVQRVAAQVGGPRGGEVPLRDLREQQSVHASAGLPPLLHHIELVDPRRHPNDEIVHMSNRVPFDVGIIHYASDTPYSRRQSLLSKSMSFFGVDSTYASTIAITRRIFQSEIARLSHP